MRTIRETQTKKTTLRLVEHNKAYVGLVIADGAIKLRLNGEAADDVWRRLHDEAGKASPQYFGYDGAKSRFLHFFAGGFASHDFVDAERTYKLDAKAKLDKALPIEAALTGSGHGEAALAAFRSLNLLSPFEKVRLQDALRGPLADAFVRGAARFAMGETKAGLIEMERALKPSDCAKWTVVTYLPFLWRPDANMFLKPEVTKDFASRVGHRFANDYSPRLDISTYESLLALTSETEAKISELAPRDRIDIQSFIWVVGDYLDDREELRP